MPGSWPYLRTQIREYLTQNFPPTAKVLDIGAGEGTYSMLLSDYFTHMDAVEIWTPYIDAYDLHNKYNHVYNCDVMTIDGNTFSQYNIAIIGDTLEHLSVEDGMRLIQSLSEHVSEVVVIVPFNLPQNGVYDPTSDSFNPYEEHLQPDLSFDNFFERYPQLKFLPVHEQYRLPNNEAQVRVDVGDNIYHLCAFIKK